MDDNAQGETQKRRRAYARHLHRRMRVLNTAAWLRAGGIQMVWLVVLVAGAAIPLTDALVSDGWDWVNPVLGFVIVIAAGIERIFGRTTDAAVALDVLRRGLAHEQRLFAAGGGRYADQADPFTPFVERVEELIDNYDQAMVAYHARSLRSTP